MYLLEDSLKYLDWNNNDFSGLVTAVGLGIDQINIWSQFLSEAFRGKCCAVDVYLLSGRQ